MPLVAASNEIEAMVIGDIIALLTTAGMTAYPEDAAFSDSAPPTYPLIAVGAGNISDAMGGNGQGLATGIWRVPVTLTGMTLAGVGPDDDQDGAELRELVGDARDALATDDLVARLNALGSAHYYACTDWASDLPGPDGRIRNGTLGFHCIMQPGIEVTTTTTEG